MTSATTAKLYHRLMTKANSASDETLAEALQLLAEALILTDIDRARQEQTEALLYKLERFIDR